MSRVTDLISQYEDQCCQDRRIINLNTARTAGCRTVQEAEVRVSARSEKGATKAADKSSRQVARQKKDAEILALYPVSVQSVARQTGVPPRRVKEVWRYAILEAATRPDPS